MKRILTCALGAALASCGPEPQPSQPDTLPTPSGPPLAQQASPEPIRGPAPPSLQWESVVKGDGMSLRLVEAGEEKMVLACRGSPRRLGATVPGFRAIASEDRFTLGLGGEPVTLVADMRREEGVSAEGPVPDDVRELLEQAEQVTALYGTQQIGPAPAPPPGLARAFAQECGKRAG